MQALKLLNDGKLDDAVASAAEFIRDNPTDSGGREVLAEMLCLRGEWSRADKQVETLMMQQPQAAISASLLRQLIRAEAARQDVWFAGRLPEFLGAPGNICKQTLAALVSLRNNEPEEAANQLETLAGNSPDLQGTCNDQAFFGFRDLDDTCFGIFEVLTSTGKYYWIPINRVISMAFEPTTRPRDLIWRQCHLSVHDGPDGVVYLPATYINTDRSTESVARLARTTDWSEHAEGLVQGIGQKLYLAGEVEMGLMDMRSLQFGPDHGESQADVGGDDDSGRS